MSASRTVTLDTIDHGQVTFDCPAWCIGHGWQVGAGIGRNDIAHNSVRVKAGVETDGHGWLPMLNVYISWAPFRELVPIVAVDLQVQADFEAEEIASVIRGMETAVARLGAVAAEAIRLRGELS